MPDLVVASPNQVTYKQQTPSPTRKVAAAGFVGAICTIATWVVNTYHLLPNGQQVPADIALAFTTAISFVVCYFVPPSADDQLVISAPE